MTQSSSSDRIQQLLSPERRERLDVHRILSLLPIRPYLIVADIGCGPGLFTIPLAKTLWDGKVYALDTEEEMLDTVRQRAQEARLGNIVTLKSEEAALPLEEDSMDGAMLVCVLHEVSDRTGFVKEVVKALRHSAWCAVIEWRAEAEKAEGPPAKNRIPEEEMVRLAAECGLRVSLRRKLNDFHYLVVLQKQ